MKKIVLLKGCAGLGNRLFTLVNAAEYANQTNRTLIVDWNDGLYYPMDYNFFSDFFKLKNIEYIAPKQSELAIFLIFLKHLLKTQNKTFIINL